MRLDNSTSLIRHEIQILFRAMNITKVLVVNQSKQGAVQGAVWSLDPSKLHRSVPMKFSNNRKVIRLFLVS